MNRLVLNRWDSNYRLADVLVALSPMLGDYLFFVGDFEPGWWVSPESRLWVYVITEGQMHVPGTEAVLLSYANVCCFAKSSIGMGDYELRIAERPSDLHSNNWIGIIAEYMEFEIAFREEHLVNEAQRLLRLSGFKSVRTEMTELHEIAKRGHGLDPYFRRDVENILQGWDDDCYRQTGGGQGRAD